MTAARCLICKRKISDPDSLKRGIGATCWKRLHPPKPKKVKKARVKKRRLRSSHGVKEWHQEELPLFQEEE